jgi:hypothetical protein
MEMPLGLLYQYKMGQYFPLVSNYLIYYFSPIFGFFFSLLVWGWRQTEILLSG